MINPKAKDRMTNKKTMIINIISVLFFLTNLIKFDNISIIFKNMAKTKSAGSSRLGRDSNSQRLGVKAFAGEKVKAGMIIIRQRGTKFLPGKNVKKGKDDTIYSQKAGIVSFVAKTKRKFDNSKKIVNVVNVD